MLHGSTRVITLNKSCELSNTACGTWSNLDLIVLRLCEFEYPVWWPEGGSLELLAMLDFTHHQETERRPKKFTDRYMIVSNKVKDCQQQAVLHRQFDLNVLELRQCVACGFSHMQRHRCQPFSTLIVRQMQSKLGAQIMAQLVTLKLPNLVQLDLGCNKLDAAATAELIQLLVAISLEGNNVDGMGVEWLTKARWQKLLSLSLDSRAASLRTYTALSLPAASFRTKNRNNSFKVSRVVNVGWPSLEQVYFFSGFA